MPEEINRVPLPGNISDMTYDDTADEILALSIEERALIRYPHDLVREPTQSDIPSEVPLAGYGAGGLGCSPQLAHGLSVKPPIPSIS